MALNSDFAKQNGDIGTLCAVIVILNLYLR